VTDGNNFYRSNHVISSYVASKKPGFKRSKYYKEAMGVRQISSATTAQDGQKHFFAQI
jgi:hypothetical protein